MSHARTERFCPFCDVPMSQVRVEGKVQLDQCDRCGATWYEKGELRRVRRLRGESHEKERTTRRRARPTRQAPLMCPQCDLATLRTTHVGATPIAFCDSCGGSLLPKERLSHRRGLMRAFAAPKKKAGAAGIVAFVAIVVAWVLLGLF